MMRMREVVIVSGVRTAIGTFGGSLKDFSPVDMGVLVAREALKRSGLAAEAVGHVVFGNVIQSKPEDMYLARVIALKAGISKATPALTVNRLCGSGLQAIISAAQSIMLGDCDTALAGGSESMSQAPYSSQAPRFGARLGDVQLTDMLLGALTDPIHDIHMGFTAENVARTYHISRSAQDELALQSHQRAARAIAEGRFKRQILPILVKDGRTERIFDTDEHVRPNSQLEDFQQLKPVFDREHGQVTAGNASGLNDGAAAVILMEHQAAKAKGCKPMARLVSYAHAGVDPKLMGIGPVPATRMALLKAGLNIADLDVIEANEAFAAQACAVANELDLPTYNLNPNGSGISLGHPIGATGAIITLKALHELERIGGRYALVTMCIGGGQGIAAIFERM